MVLGLPDKAVTIVQIDLVARLDEEVPKLGDVPLNVGDLFGLGHLVNCLGDLRSHGNWVKKQKLQEKIVLYEDVCTVPLDILNFMWERHRIQFRDTIFQIRRNQVSLIL